MADSHKNFAYSTVATAPSPATSGTTLVVQTGDGSKFPAVPFNATVWPIGLLPTTANAEVVRVTGISTDTLTIARAQESSSARTVVVGDQIAATVTAKTLSDLETDLANALSQIGLLTAQLAVDTLGQQGYYVVSTGNIATGSGFLSPAIATATKLDMAAGTDNFNTVSLTYSQQLTISTTIATLAGAANSGAGLTVGQSMWVNVELDTSSVVNFNSGSAATSPTIPTVTAGRVIHGWIWIPYNAGGYGSGMDTQLTNANGLAKLIDARVFRASVADIQIITATGDTVITRPAGAKACFVRLIGGGGAGGSGEKNTTGSTVLGGGGGGGGAGGLSETWFNAADLAATETITVGLGGTTGGTSTAAGAAPNGGAGGASKFTVNGLVALWAAGGSGGTGGGVGAVAGAGGGGGNSGAFTSAVPTGPGGQGGDGNASSNAVAGTQGGTGGPQPGAGGGGGGIATGNAPKISAAGGRSSPGFGTTGNGIAGGAAGATGFGGGPGRSFPTDIGTNQVGGGSGGGGAAHRPNNVNGVGLTGGAGGNYGGGGGGGGNGVGTGAGGPGGAGANGAALIVWVR